MFGVCSFVPGDFPLPASRLPPHRHCLIPSSALPNQAECLRSAVCKSAKQGGGFSYVQDWKQCLLPKEAHASCEPAPVEDTGAPLAVYYSLKVAEQELGGSNWQAGGDEVTVDRQSNDDGDVSGGFLARLEKDTASAIVAVASAVPVKPYTSYCVALLGYKSAYPSVTLAVTQAEAEASFEGKAAWMQVAVDTGSASKLTLTVTAQSEENMLAPLELMAVEKTVVGEGSCVGRPCTAHEQCAGSDSRPHKARARCDLEATHVCVEVCASVDDERDAHVG